MEVEDEEDVAVPLKQPQEEGVLEEVVAEEPVQEEWVAEEEGEEEERLEVDVRSERNGQIFR